MEIYIYGLIAAGYLILAFVSRDGAKIGTRKMAEYLYRKGKGLGRIAKRRGTYREGGVRRDLALLYPFGQLRKEEKRFYIERIRIVLLIILAGDLLAAANYAAAGGNMLLTDSNELVRDEIGGEDRSTQVDVYILEKESEAVYQGSYRLNVRSKRYSETEAEKLASDLFRLLPARILGQNSTLEHVTFPMELPTCVEGYPFKIAWESSSYALIDSDGKVGNLAMEENDSREVLLTAVLSYDNGTPEGLRFEQEYKAVVFPPRLTEEEKLSARIREAIREADEKSVSDDVLPLPTDLEKAQSQNTENQNTENRNTELGKTEAGNTELIWEEKAPDSGIAVILFAAAVSFLAAVSMGSRLHQKVVLRERQMVLDYPQIVSKFVLYLGAGMSIRSTFIKLGEDYTRQREEGMAEHGAYEEILLVMRELTSGVPETEAYERFGQRCRSRQYTKLCTLLAQNLRKGNQELLTVMQQEAKASFEERRNTARKLGEEAETKLLLPMVMMLAITMLIIIIPAYYSFAG